MPALAKPHRLAYLLTNFAHESFRIMQNFSGSA
jgi:hypothetical protein